MSTYAHDARPSALEVRPQQVQHVLALGLLQHLLDDHEALLLQVRERGAALRQELGQGLRCETTRKSGQKKDLTGNTSQGGLRGD